MPEYAVDLVFIRKSAHHPKQAHYAIANITDTNRLLLGLGWLLVLAAVSHVLNRKALIPAARMGFGLTQKE
jgi:cation:H+ antiporter